MANLRASENPFPSVLFRETVDPANPDAGDQRLFVDTDHLLKMRDSAGTVTTFGAGMSDPMTTRGDIIIRDSSNTTARLAIGSSGKVLTSDGTDISWQTPAAAAGSVVWLQRQTASTSATLDFTSFISSTYDVYRFDFVNLFPATDNVNLLMRMGTGGGPTYETGANYHWQNTQGNGTGTAATSNNAGTSIQLTPAVDNAAGSTWTITGSILMFNPMSTGVLKFVQGQFVSLFNTGPAFAQNIVGGSYSLTTAVTAVRFYMSSGNITSGSIDCYGLKHA